MFVPVNITGEGVPASPFHRVANPAIPFCKNTKNNGYIQLNCEKNPIVSSDKLRNGATMYFCAVISTLL